MDKRIISLLNTIRDRPGMYIGQKSLTDLWHFLNGYTFCLFETDNEFSDMSGFQRYIEYVYETNITQSWAKIINFYNPSEEKALYCFYEHLDEYLNQLDEIFESKEVHLIYLSKEFEDHDRILYKYSIKHKEWTKSLESDFGSVEWNKKSESLSQLLPLTDVPSYIAQHVSSTVHTWLGRCKKKGNHPDQAEINY